MRKVFYLKTCGTCTKILNQFDLTDWELREIKTKPITTEELSEMYEKTKSYEKLFSRRSTQIKGRNIDAKNLNEDDCRKLILDHYSFLKRPVFLTDKEIFVGNEKKNLEELQSYFNLN